MTSTDLVWFTLKCGATSHVRLRSSALSGSEIFRLSPVPSGLGFRSYAGMDNFRVNVHSHVPEPSAAMLGIAGVVLIMGRRRD